MTEDQIKANLDDAARSWTRRMEAERLEIAEHRRRAERYTRTIETLIAVGGVVTMSVVSALLAIYFGIWQ